MGEWKEYKLGDVIKDNAPAFGTPSLLKEGEGGVSILKAGVNAVMEGPD